MDPIKVDFTNKGSNKKKEIVIPPERTAVKIIISILGSIVTAAVAYYFMLPAINLKDTNFYVYIGIVIASFVFFLAILTKVTTKPEYIPFVKKSATVPGILIGLLLVVGIAGGISSWVVFRANSYSNLITVNENGDFAKEIDKQSADTYGGIPRLDEAAAANLANRALSGLSKLGKVSQYTVYPQYTQINYKGEPVRVASLQYASIIKWFTNRKDGFPGYITINMATQKTEFVKSENSIRFSPAEHFGHLLKRYLRFNYPTYLFGTPVFELDESGNPNWICPRIDKTIGLFGGTDVIGFVLMDPTDPDGNSTYYTYDQAVNDKSLKWIDRLYSSDILIEQYTFHGKYNGGFWNSILGQKNVFITTDGHSYLAKDDDVFLYTGVTSVTSDQSIIGFILINQRTKDATFYQVAGATETTAMETAQGMVQDLGYTASFPLLVNVSDQPTYFMALKDSEQVNQKFAMIHVEKYNTIKVVGESLPNCLELYLKALENAGIKTDIDIEDINDNGNVPDVDKVETLTAAITEIRTAVIDGESNYYFKLAGSNTYYAIAASKSKLAIILNNGDQVTITYKKADTAIIAIESLEIAKATIPEQTTAVPATAP